MVQANVSTTYGNGAPAMFTSQYYLKLRCKHCRKPNCPNGVVDTLGLYSTIIQANWRQEPARGQTTLLQDTGFLRILKGGSGVSLRTRLGNTNCLYLCIPGPHLVVTVLNQVFAKGQLISEASFVGLTQARTETLQKTFCLLFERLEANKNQFCNKLTFSG